MGAVDCLSPCCSSGCTESLRIWLYVSCSLCNHQSTDAHNAMSSNEEKQWDLTEDEVQEYLCKIEAIGKWG